MSSPHERDDRFYGYNQDPYTRNPHLDPYTGYQRGTPDNREGWSLGVAFSKFTIKAR